MKISLNGKWRVYIEEKEFDFEGNVPGTVQGDLVNLNLMPHPYVGTNEKLFRRLEEKSWIYERTFYIDKLDRSPTTIWCARRCRYSFARYM